MTVSYPHFCHELVNTHAARLVTVKFVIHLFAFLKTKIQLYKLLSIDRLPIALRPIEKKISVKIVHFKVQRDSFNCVRLLSTPCVVIL